MTPDTGTELIEAIRNSNVGQEVELSYYEREELLRKTVRLAPDAESALPDNRPRIDGSKSPRSHRCSASRSLNVNV